MAYPGTPGVPRPRMQNVMCVTKNGSGGAMKHSLAIRQGGINAAEKIVRLSIAQVVGYLINTSTKEIVLVRVSQLSNLLYLSIEPWTRQSLGCHC